MLSTFPLWTGRGAVPFDTIIDRTPRPLMDLDVFRVSAQPLHESSPGAVCSSTQLSMPRVESFDQTTCDAAHTTNEHLARG